MEAWHRFEQSYLGFNSCVNPKLLRVLFGPCTLDYSKCSVQSYPFFSCSHGLFMPISAPPTGRLMKPHCWQSWNMLRVASSQQEEMLLVDGWLHVRESSYPRLTPWTFPADKSWIVSTGKKKNRQKSTPGFWIHKTFVPQLSHLKSLRLVFCWLILPESTSQLLSKCSVLTHNIKSFSRIDLYCTKFISLICKRTNFTYSI